MRIGEIIIVIESLKSDAEKLADKLLIIVDEHNKLEAFIGDLTDGKPTSMGAAAEIAGTQVSAVLGKTRNLILGLDLLIEQYKAVT